MTNTNKMTLIMDNGKITIKCESNGHPLDEVVRMLFKGLKESGCMTSG